MPRPQTRVALDDLERLEMAGQVARAARAAFPDAAAGTASWLDLGSIGRVTINWIAAGFGGVRPVWRCPTCGARRRVLYLLRPRLGCRGCLWVEGRPLIYQSQRLDPSTRAQVRGDALAQRLGGEDGRCVPDKPPRMWWSTWERLARRIVALEALRVERLNTGARLARIAVRLARHR